MSKINLGDKAKDLVSGFVGIVTTKIQCLNGCTRYELSETAENGKKNEFRTVELDSQVVEKIDDGLNKVKKIKQTGDGGPTKFHVTKQKKINDQRTNTKTKSRQ